MNKLKNWLTGVLCLFVWMGLWKFILLPFLVKVFELNDSLPLYNLTDLLGYLIGGFLFAFISIRAKKTSVNKKTTL
ncbi:hypothetical protein GN157_10530 [Flavobacterium rakeshii]|uniref:Uncharacterized protein n=1 Tax=Flavobacterium rakeshii TaxID=1038845 RepID=A0A6N8HCA1_9FLAO|nr:hypothetical protein [Flavobacterium rakeshii]MEE1898848.1 hypothetical protein [Flavobacterium rakeshii]MUV04144.1 hypothetical protein [Flavobacterium rakeshii]